MAWFQNSKKKPSTSSRSKDKKPKTPAKRSSMAVKAAARAAASTPEAAHPVKKSEPKIQKEQIVPQPSAPAVVAESPKYQEAPRELPWNYGDNHIYLMVRDPYWIYSYWEIQKDHQERTLQKLGGNWDQVWSVLRVYDVTESQPSYFDIILQGLSSSWYVQVQPNRSYVVEIGLLHSDGRYIALARSNQVKTPRSGMSEVIDEQWMGLDFDKMYALSGGFEVGKSSAELRKLMEERLMGAVTSGSGAGMISSMASPVKKVKKRGFWFVLDCELIVYGATEPDATVTMRGKKVKLRPDGTFTLRYALPDGKLVLDAYALSADGVEERAIIPVVTRETKRPAPVFKKEWKETD